MQNDAKLVSMSISAVSQVPPNTTSPPPPEIEEDTGLGLPAIIALAKAKSEPSQQKDSGRSRPAHGVLHGELVNCGVFLGGWWRNFLGWCHWRNLRWDPRSRTQFRSGSGMQQETYGNISKHPMIQTVWTWLDYLAWNRVEQSGHSWLEAWHLARRIRCSCFSCILQDDALRRKNGHNKCNGNGSIQHTDAYSNIQQRAVQYMYIFVCKLDLRGAVRFRFNFNGAVILQLFESGRSKKPVEPEEEEEEEAKSLFKSE